MTGHITGLLYQIMPAQVVNYAKELLSHSLNKQIFNRELYLGYRFTVLPIEDLESRCYCTHRLILHVNDWCNQLQLHNDIDCEENILLHNIRIGNDNSIPIDILVALMHDEINLYIGRELSIEEMELFADYKFDIIFIQADTNNSVYKLRCNLLNAINTTVQSVKLLNFSANILLIDQALIAADGVYEDYSVVIITHSRYSSINYRETFPNAEIVGYACIHPHIVIGQQGVVISAKNCELIGLDITNIIAYYTKFNTKRFNHTKSSYMIG